MELEQNVELHWSCDFIMKNFEICQTTRDEEVEALKQAKSTIHQLWSPNAIRLLSISQLTLTGKWLWNRHGWRTMRTLWNFLGLRKPWTPKCLVACSGIV